MILRSFHAQLRLDQLVRLEKLDPCCPTSEKLRQAVDEYLSKREGGKYDGMTPLAVLQGLEEELSIRLAQCRAEITANGGGAVLEK